MRNGPGERFPSGLQVVGGFREHQRVDPRTVGPGTKGFVGGGEAAIGLRSSSTLVGLAFGSVANTATGFAGSAPIAGKVQLEGLYILCGVLPAAGAAHLLQLGIDSDVPSSQGDVDAAEQLFARAATVAGEESSIFFGGLGRDVFLPLTTVLAMNGRRLIGRATNLSTTASGYFYAGLLMHRVYGGASSGDPAFLSGEEVEIR